MNELTLNSATTFESVLASLQETGRSMSEQFAELRLQSQETDRKFQETDRKFKESQEAFERRWEKYEQKMKKVDKEMGSWANNFGSFAEEYFFNSFDYGEQNFFGEQFDDIKRKVHPVEPHLEDEYDIVLYNGTSVAIIEVKYKAHENDIPEVLKKAETFRILCPKYKDFKIYLALASMAFYPELEQKCMQQGIAIIKQVGDMVVIEDGHLKVF
jgi:hypothetical protein